MPPWPLGAGAFGTTSTPNDSIHSSKAICACVKGERPLSTRAHLPSPRDVYPARFVERSGAWRGGGGGGGGGRGGEGGATEMADCCADAALPRLYSGSTML